MRQKKLVIGLLVMLAVMVSSVSYAIWQSVDFSEDVVAGTVTIGEGRTASVTASLNTPGTGTLVPSGFAASSTSTNPVESLTFTFDVLWSDTQFDATASTVAVTVGNVSNATANTYLNFAVTGGSPLAITAGTTLTVTITVTLTEPTTQADYDAIINQAVTFDVTFVVTNPGV